ncbi:MAG: CHAT domain-containing protein [Bacteroidota bacterium]|nr:CHAT domain-containing protein [Bacteroidota bacterium]
MKGLQLLKYLPFIALLACNTTIFAQKWNKKYKIAQKRYTDGYYQSSYRFTKRLISKIEKAGAPSEAQLYKAYYFQALNAEALTKFSEMDSLVKKTESLINALPSDSTTQKALGFAGLAYSYYQYGNYAKANQYYKKATAISQPNKSVEQQINFQIALNNYKSGFYNEALTLVNVLQNQKNDQLFDKTLSRASLTLVKNEYASIINLKAEILFAKGNFNSCDSAVKQNAEWIQKNLKKRNLAFRDNLYLKGKLAEKNEQFKYATKMYESANKYTKYRPLEKTGANVAESLIKLYYTRNKKHESIKGRIKFDRAVQRAFGKNSFNYARYRFQEVELLQSEGKYSKAEKRLLALYNTNKKFIIDHDLHVKILNTKADLAIKKGAYDEAEDTLIKSLAIKSKLYGEDAPEFHKLKLLAADFYANYANKFSLAAAIQDYSYNKVVAPQLSNQNMEKMKLMQQVANTYDIIEKYDLAIKYLEEASNNIKAYYGTENTMYASDLEKTAEVLIKKGDYAKAEQLIRQAVDIFQRTSTRKNAAEQANTYLALAKLYNLLGLYDDAEAALKKAGKLSKKSKNYRTQQAAKSMDELAALYIKEGRFNEAEKFLEAAVKEKEKKFGNVSKDLITTLNLSGELYLITGNYAKSEKNIRRSMAITTKIYGDSSVRFTESLQLIERLYRELGDLKKAEETAQQVLRIERKQLGNNHIDVANTLTRLALIKLYSGNNPLESEKMLLEALRITKFNLGDQNPQYADQLKSIALFYIFTSKFDRADSCLNVANNIWLTKLGKTNAKSAEIALLKGNVLYRKSEYPKAIAKYSEAKNMYNSVFSNKHPGYVEATSKLARAYYMNNEVQKSINELNSATANYLEFTKKYFPSLSFSEKSKYWASIKEDFELYNSIAMRLQGQNPSVLAGMYTNIISTKALLLSSSIKVKERILNSKDDKLIAKFNLWSEKKQFLLQVAGMSKEQQVEAGVNSSQLEKEINQLEKELSESSELFASGLDNKIITWKDVRKALKANEYAVEITRFRHFNKTFTDSIVYVALVLSNNSDKAPTAVFIPDGKLLETKYIKYYKNVVINRLEGDDYSYDAYWKVLKKAIPDNATIFLSNEGVYNEINVEGLQSADNSYVIDKNNVVIVSNTKDILKRKTQTVGKVVAGKALFIGNPVFYGVTTVNAWLASASSTDRSAPAFKARMVNTGEKMATVSQLPGTEAEVNDIEKLFTSNGWKTKKMIQHAADEDSLKYAKNPNIIHIATHGYFKPNDDPNEFSDLGASETELLQNPLLKSGLLVKGAGDVLSTGSSLSINNEKGILTAYEAMDMTLDNTDLVVLSACETGLGEVQIGEGVFGLQRAFLVAGANRLVMTLFKVDDLVTKELMMTFYKNWLSTGDLRKSFADAKRDIKQKYKYPVYWSSFVMIGI